MTWHLKDRELEKKLNELSNGEFSKILNEADMKNPNCICFTIDKKEDIELSVYLRPEAIEPEYDPHDWNEFPKVKPPYDVMMRIEFENGEGTKGFYKHCFDGSDYWFGNSRMAFSKTMLINNPIKRFRPWED